MKISYILLLCLIAVNASSLDSNTYRFEKSEVKAILAKKEGNNLLLGIEYKLAKGWKIYWVYPGDTGLPTSLDIIDKPSNASVDIKWPFPEELYEKEVELTSRVYTEHVILPVYINNLNSDKKKLKLLLDFQICKDICIPISTVLEIRLPSKNFVHEENFKKINKFSSKLAKNIDSSQSFEKKSVTQVNDNIIITLKKKDIKKGKFDIKEVKGFLHNDDINTLRFLKYQNKKDQINIFLTGYEKIKESNLSNKSSLIFVKINEEIYFWEEGQIVTINSNNKNDLVNFSIILFSAFLGGIVLNFMPCVLPVLGIKITSFVQQLEYKEKNIIKLSSIAIIFGIISTFLLFALFTVMLRLLGSNVGWGMQFQSPTFLILMIIILTFFMLNLLGLFNIKIPRFFSKLSTKQYFNNNSNIYLKNYLTGILSTLLATPCTAPFVGTAVSFALTQSYLSTFLIFIFMATGKALPYFIFIFYPNIVSLLPKPGKWFIYLKYFFALMLLFSVIWLGNIFFDTNKYRSEQKLDYWETFDIKLIREYLDKDEKIFVDVTAKWCLTCAINKKLVLDSKIIKDLFSKNNIKILRADWTDRNEDILQYLKTFNKYGIPFNVFYNKNYPNGYIFNEILTKKEVIKIIKQNQ